jgi:hypothetical protein
VEQATNAIENGSKEMSKAVKSSRGARKKKWIIFGIVMVILIILGVYIYMTFIAPAQVKDKIASAASGGDTKDVKDEPDNPPPAVAKKPVDPVKPQEEKVVEGGQAPAVVQQAPPAEIPLVETDEQERQAPPADDPPPQEREEEPVFQPREPTPPQAREEPPQQQARETPPQAREEPPQPRLVMQSAPLPQAREVPEIQKSVVAVQEPQEEEEPVSFVQPDVQSSEAENSDPPGELIA